MTTPVPVNPKIYHIVHMDRIASIIQEGFLWSDAVVQSKEIGGTMIGMSHIKQRRLTNSLQSHSDLTVGQCVPFYFCPRSIMLYIISQQQHEDISYRGGQAPIVHLQADLNQVVQWSNQNGKRWAFTKSNAGSYYFDDYCSLDKLGEIDWNAVNAHSWSQCKESKQAEFLLEYQFPWTLVEEIGIYSQTQYQQVCSELNVTAHRPPVLIKRNWYY